jgi:type I restriction enzyme S subunit
MTGGPRLEDLCEFIVDCPHKTAPTQSTGVPQVRTTDIKNGRLDLVRANKVSEATYQEWIARAEPSPGDLILAREAPVGQVGMVPRGAKVCLGQRTVLIRPDPTCVHPRYLLFLMLSPAVQAEMQGRAAGSTTPHLNVADIRYLQLPDLPNRSVQNEVAALLGVLDDKIDVNQRIGETLGLIARALFRSWFVDFDSVRGTSTAPEDVQRLFPARLVESPIGPVPDGWDVADVSALVLVSRATIDPRDHPDEEFDHFSIPAFDADQMPSVERGEREA